jgi:rhomboid protease GluP
MEQNTESGGQKKNSFFTPFIPREGYFFTPILININLLVFALMVMNGVDPLTPNGNVLLKWGANFGLLTLNGEWWRVFTSQFLHVGLIHLGANMYALYNIGSSLENLTGRWRFLILYLCAGVAGNALSLWWHRDAPVPGAGASGAVFGLFGLGLALFTTDIIRKDVRGYFLRKLGEVVVMNLIIGFMVSMIDNSAHIGGLIMGVIGGYCLYIDLRALYFKRQKQILGTVLLILISAASFAYVLSTTNSGESKTVKLQLQFSDLAAANEKALKFRTDGPVIAPAEQIEKKYIAPWYDYMKTIGEMEKTSSDDAAIRDEIQRLHQYGELRLDAADYYLRSAKENRKDFLDSGMVIDKQAEKLEYLFQPDPKGE